MVLAGGSCDVEVREISECPKVRSFGLTLNVRGDVDFFIELFLPAWLFLLRIINAALKWRKFRWFFSKELRKSCCNVNDPSQHWLYVFLKQPQTTFSWSFTAKDFPFSLYSFSLPWPTLGWFSGVDCYVFLLSSLAHLSLSLSMQSRDN